MGRGLDKTGAKFEGSETAEKEGNIGQKQS